MGSKVRIMIGCRWKIVSTGLDRPVCVWGGECFDTTIIMLVGMNNCTGDHTT